MSEREPRISEEMGGLLWRRVYEARKNAESHVDPMLADTLEALLRQAKVPEPNTLAAESGRTP